MKKIIINIFTISMIIILMTIILTNIINAETQEGYNVEYKECIPLDQIIDPLNFDIIVKINNQNLNLNDSIDTLNPTVDIDIRYYDDNNLIYFGEKTKLLHKHYNTIIVKINKIDINYPLDYREFYYRFRFNVIEKNIEITPSPTEIITTTNSITNSPTPTNVITPTNSIVPSNTNNITPTNSIVPSNIETPSPTNEFIISNTDNNIVSSNNFANNKKLPKTGETKPIFLLIGGGFVTLLGTFYFVAKLKK